MKEKDGYVDCPEQQMILYVEKEDGKYGPMQTGSYISANYLDDYYYKRRNLEAGLREQVVNGLISPVKYYMTLGDLSISELSARAGIRKSKVKKHLEMVHFKDLTVAEFDRYLVVFNVPAEQMDLIFFRKDDSREEQTNIEERIV